MLAELLHGEVALLLRQVSVQRFSVVAVVYQLVGYLLRLAFCAAEDYGEYFREVVYHAFQRQILVLGVHHVVYMVYVLGSFVAASHHNLLRVVQVVACNLLYFLAHRGREEQRVAVFGHAFEYLVDAFREAHVEHFVGFVEHNVPHGVELCHSAVHQVDKTAGRGHYYLCPVAQRLYLVFDRSAAVYGHDVDAVDVFGKVLQIVGYLQAQLPGGTEDERLCLTHTRVGALQHRNAERSRLARARLGQRNYVVSVTK